jgi:hypothetical protein
MNTMQLIQPGNKYGFHFRKSFKWTRLHIDSQLKRHSHCARHGNHALIYRLN